MTHTLRIISRAEVAGLLSFRDHVMEVERAFRLHAQGRSLLPQLMHVDAPEGEFHVKAGGLQRGRWYWAVKANGSFFRNPERHGRPAIQGAILLFDAETGTPLALVDSSEITVQRTGAATAVAARVLARPDSTVATICGCGRQGRVHLTALQHVLSIETVFAWDRDPAAAMRFADEAEVATGLSVTDVPDVESAVRASDVVVTCTPSREPFVRADWVRPGTFVAAVGADSPGKQELEARLLAAPTRVVVDLVEQAAHVGELQHALRAGLVRREDVHAELGEVLEGQKPGREREADVFVYDATGTALQDVAAAAAAYERAVTAGVGIEVQLSR